VLAVRLDERGRFATSVYCNENVAGGTQWQRGFCQGARWLAVQIWTLSAMFVVVRVAVNARAYPLPTAFVVVIVVTSA
jgi:hypothetical protein